MQTPQGGASDCGSWNAGIYGMVEVRAPIPASHAKSLSAEPPAGGACTGRVPSLCWRCLPYGESQAKGLSEGPFSYHSNIPSFHLPQSGARIPPIQPAARLSQFRNCESGRGVRIDLRRMPCSLLTTKDTKSTKGLSRSQSPGSTTRQLSFFVSLRALRGETRPISIRRERPHLPRHPKPCHDSDTHPITNCRCPAVDLRTNFA